MAKYRMSVSFDEKNFFWMVVDNGKFIRNPTKEDLMGTKLKFYSKTNTCPICIKEYEREGRELTNKSILYPNNVLHNIDKYGNKTDEYVCKRHHDRNWQKYNPNSTNNIIRSLADRRTGNQDPNSENTNGDNFEELTDRWLGTKRLSIKNDNYTGPLDHTPIANETFVYIGGKLVDLSGKIPQTKGNCFNLTRGYWKTGGSLKNEWSKEFDYVIFYCASEDGNVIERIYIIPKEEIYDLATKQSRTNITVTKNPTDKRGNPKDPNDSWYEKYRIIDENTVRKVNKMYEIIIKSTISNNFLGTRK